MLVHPPPEVGKAESDVLPDPDGRQLTLPGQLVHVAPRDIQEVRHVLRGAEPIPLRRVLRLAVAAGRCRQEPGRQSTLKGRKLRQKGRHLHRRDLCHPARVGQQLG